MTIHGDDVSCPVDRASLVEQNEFLKKENAILHEDLKEAQALVNRSLDVCEALGEHIEELETFVDKFANNVLLELERIKK